MSEKWHDEQEQAEGAIQAYVYEGRPNELAKAGERSRWQRFKGLLFPHLKEKWALAERLAEAKVRQEEATAVKIAVEARKTAAEARKTAEEAAEIAARKDSEQLDAVKKVFDLVDDLGVDAEAAQTLKLAKFLEANPAIAGQIEKIGDIIERLRIVRGLTVGQIKGALPTSTESGAGESASDEAE